MGLGVDAQLGQAEKSAVETNAETDRCSASRPPADYVYETGQWAAVVSEQHAGCRATHL